MISALAGHVGARMRCAALAALTTLLGIALGFGALVSAPGAIAGEIGAERASVAPVADEAASVVITGRVTRGGKPLRATVDAVATPEQDVLESYAIGETIPFAAVGRASTDLDGRYRLVIDPAQVPPEHIDEEGLVNLDLRFADSAGEGTYSVSVGGSRWTPADGSTPQSTARVTRVSIDLANGNVTDSTIDSSTMVDPAGNQLAPEDRPTLTAAVGPRSADFDSAIGELSDGTGVLPLACGPRVIARKYDIKERVHRLQGTSKLKATAVAVSGRDETMGIAVSRTGAAGSFDASGTSTISKQSRQAGGP